VKIVAVIVTHNRSALLARCLDHLARQARPPARTIVIDNGSTDGTRDMLDRRGVEYVAQENLGSAGGWHRGIEFALAEGYDAVWLMDDDGFPDAGALQVLESALVEGVACVSSVVLQENARERFVFPFPVLGRRGLPVVFGLPRKYATLGQLAEQATDGRYPYAHFFNGALISVAAVRAVGNVDKRFFIFGEEVDYFFRLRGFGRVESVLAARHYHPDVSGRPYSPAKVYYYVKNTIILNRRYFDRVWVRNGLALAAVLARTATRNGLGSAFSYLVGRDARAFYGAIARGLRGQVGRDFDG
jgi:GT2 family glycosyltransferase